MKDVRMTQRIVFLLILLGALCTFPALAGAQSGPPQSLEGISRFVGPQTFLVARIDVSAIDLEALSSFFARTLCVEQQLIAQQIAIVDAFKTNLEKIGGREVYMILSTADLFENAPVLVLPIEAPMKSDAFAAVQGVLKAGFRDWECEESGEYVLCGKAPALKRVRALDQPVRPEIGRAFRAAGKAPAQVVLIPTEDMRRVVREIMPTLPREMGGGPGAVLSRGIMWSALGVTLPPRPAFQFVIQSRDASAARALHNSMDKAVRREVRGSRWFKELPRAEYLVKMLMPGVEGDRLVVSLGPGEVERVIGAVIVPVVEKQRARARITASIDHMKQIFSACMQYRKGHDEKWPPELQALSGEYVPPAVLKSQRQDVSGHYAYLRPPSEVTKSEQQSRLVVIYEAHDSWPEAGVNVGFVDGHVELVTDEKSFRDYLSRTKKAYSQMRRKDVQN